MVLTSLLSGSVFGLLGSVGGGILDYLKTKEQNKHQLAMLNAQKDLINAQGANAVALEHAKSFAISNESDQATYFKGSLPTGAAGVLLSFLMVIVDFLRGFTRPGITWYLIAAATFVAVDCMHQTEFTQEFISKTAYASIALLLDLVALCVGFWFGGKTIKIK